MKEDILDIIIDVILLIFGILGIIYAVSNDSVALGTMFGLYSGCVLFMTASDVIEIIKGEECDDCTDESYKWGRSFYSYSDWDCIDDTEQDDEMDDTIESDDDEEDVIGLDD